MTLFKSLIAALALASAPAFVSAPPAHAQGTKVIVIDQSRIMRESKGGLDIQQKLQNIEAQMGQELQPEASALETEGQALQTRTNGLTQQAVAADPTLVQQLQGYQQKLQLFEQKRQIRARELQLSEQKAWGLFFQQLEPVLQEVINETGADVMLDRSQIVYNGATVDMTATAITKIDARLPTVAVTRESLQQQAQAQQ